MSIELDPLAELPVVPASDVKKRGWRGVTRTLETRGALVVTNHDEPEAVIIPVREYERLVELASQERARAAAALDVLRRRFDDRLAGLRTPDAGAQLRSAMRTGPLLRGKVKAGATY
jgi:prevent-host-death family protein